MKHEICNVQDVPAEGSVILPFFGREIHVYRSENRLHAVSNTCLHLGGPLECKNGQFVCPWHNAAFDMRTGERTDGPAAQGSRLMILPTRVEGGKLYYVWAEPAGT